MPNASNKEMFANIKIDLDACGAVWVVDYRGLTVKEIQELRKVIRETGSSMKVYKNTLMHLALKEADLPTLDDLLQGPSAFVFAGEDVAAAAKVVKDFASLPSREQLIAHIAGAIAGVARGLAVTVNGVPSGLARAIQQVADQKAA